jgi:hypothetical protein
MPSYKHVKCIVAVSIKNIIVLGEVPPAALLQLTVAVRTLQLDHFHQALSVCLSCDWNPDISKKTINDLTELLFKIQLKVRLDFQSSSTVRTAVSSFRETP